MRLSDIDYRPIANGWLIEIVDIPRAAARAKRWSAARCTSRAGAPARVGP
jgi:hypothetical protein